MRNLHSPLRRAVLAAGAGAGAVQRGDAEPGEQVQARRGGEHEPAQPGPRLGEAQAENRH